MITITFYMQGEEYCYKVAKLKTVSGVTKFNIPYSQSELERLMKRENRFKNIELDHKFNELVIQLDNEDIYVTL